MELKVTIVKHWARHLAQNHLKMFALHCYNISKDAPKYHCITNHSLVNLFPIRNSRITQNIHVGNGQHKKLAHISWLDFPSQKFPENYVLKGTKLQEATLWYDNSIDHAY